MLGIKQSSKITRRVYRKGKQENYVVVLSTIQRHTDRFESQLCLHDFCTGHLMKPPNTAEFLKEPTYYDLIPLSG